MSQQIMIIGLGQFGTLLARTLFERGAEVLAVDIEQSRIDAVADFVTHAVAIDATDEGELAQLMPASRDTVVCTIGGASKDSAIICTALLRQMGCQHIVARANSQMYRRILLLVGAHEVINPELEFGRRFATHLLHRNILSDTTLGGDLELTEIILPPSMVNKNLVALALPKRYGIIVAAVRRGGDLFRPDPQEMLQEGDKLLIVSSEEALATLLKEV